MIPGGPFVSRIDRSKPTLVDVQKQRDVLDT